MGGFEIKKAPKEKEIPDDTLESFLDQQVQAELEAVRSEESSDSGTATLYILPGAFLELNEHIHWRRSTADNLSEQGGILIGNVYRDKTTQFVCGIVQHIIFSDKVGDATYIQFNHEDWIHMYKEFEDKFSHSDEGSKQLNVIGWYHTHPNMPVTMSGIDKRTHIGFFPAIWQFSAIFNPQRGIWAVFNGNECRNCNGIMFYQKEDLDNIPTEPEKEKDIELIDINRNSDVNQTSAPQAQFVIKRRSYSSLEKSNPQNHTESFRQTENSNGSVNYRQGNIGNAIKMRQWYKGEVLPNGDTCYYFPMNKNITAPQSYVISDELFWRFSSFVDKWHLGKNENIALIYHTYIKKNFYTMKSSITYHTFDLGKTVASGFIYSRNPDEFINYSCEGSSREISLVVLYSSTKKSVEELNLLYGQFNCCLWINPIQKNEFEFWILNTEAKAGNNFNIINRGNIDGIRQSPIQAEQNASHLFNDVIRGLTSSSAFNLRALSVFSGRSEYYIKAPLVAAFLEKVTQYSKFKSKFMIIISYRNLDTQGASYSINPWGHAFAQIMILDGRGGSICMKNLDHQSDLHFKTSKFAFVIYNQSIDIHMLRNELSGHSVALCANIETQEYCLYQIR